MPTHLTQCSVFHWAEEIQDFSASSGYFTGSISGATGFI